MRAFKQTVKDQYEEGVLNDLNMLDSPKAFSKHISERTDPNPIFLGWEWEVSMSLQTPYIRKVLRSSIKDKINFGDGGSPLEMRSIPATLKYHEDYLQKVFFKRRFNAPFRKSTDCGIHVHMDRAAFTKESLKKFISFVSLPDNRQFIEKIGGRSIDPIQSYWCKANVVNFKYRKNGQLSGCDIRIDKFGSQVKRVNYLSYFPTGKGVAVNTHTSMETYEFRIFASVVTKQKFLKNLEFTDALIRFTRECKFEDLPYKNFIRWVHAHANDYPYLLKESCMKLPRTKRAC